MAVYLGSNQVSMKGGMASTSSSFEDASNLFTPQVSYDIFKAVKDTNTNIIYVYMCGDEDPYGLDSVLSYNPGGVPEGTSAVVQYNSVADFSICSNESDFEPWSSSLEYWEFSVAFIPT